MVTKNQLQLGFVACRNGFRRRDNASVRSRRKGRHTILVQLQFPRAHLPDVLETCFRYWAGVGIIGNSVPARDLGKPNYQARLTPVFRLQNQLDIYAYATPGDMFGLRVKRNSVLSSHIL